MSWCKAGLGFVAAATAACGRVGFDVDDTPRGNATDYTSAVMASGPVAYYPFDDAGPKVREVVTGDVPVPEGAFVFKTPGAIVGSSALEFDGSTTRIDVGSHYGFAGRASYTFELWIRPTNVASTRFLFDRRTDVTPVDGYTMYLGESYLLSARITGDAEQSYVDGGHPTVAKWTYVVVTCTWPIPRLYLDGQLVAENDGAMTVIAGGPGHFVIGDTTPPQLFKYEGQMDELAIYDRALTGDEILAHWNVARR